MVVVNIANSEVFFGENLPRKRGAKGARPLSKRGGGRMKSQEVGRAGGWGAGGLGPGAEPSPAGFGVSGAAPQARFRRRRRPGSAREARCARSAHGWTLPRLLNVKN